MGFLDWLKRVISEEQSAPETPPEETVADDPELDAGSAERLDASQFTAVSGVIAQPPPPADPLDEPGPDRTAGSAARLDASQFTAVSAGEFRSQSLDMSNAVHRAWFSRRDRVPPAADPEVLLIDRAMVGQGVISAEDLAEIHNVGAQMDEVRPYRDLAHVRAEQAVQRSRAEKQRIKEQKKADAAERKRKWSEAVALRRRTDIVFLGRGVSDGLADRRANVEKLQAAQLPILATPADLAAALGVEIPRLRWLAYHSEASATSHYIRFTVPKKSGGERALAAPLPRLTAVQRWVLRQLLDQLPLHDAAHGFARRRSTVTNARPHVGAKVVVNMDLRDFFPTITFPRVRGLFASLGYSPAVATILALLCTECPRKRVSYADTVLHVAAGPRALPQGACTSPALSNLVSRRLDARLSGIATKLGWTYTRYADDLTLSCTDDAAAQKTAYLMARVRHIADDEGFVVNESKTRVLRPSTAQMVTGVVVNRRPGVPRKLVRRMRAILHRARFEGLEAQNRDDRPNFTAWVQGTIAYICMVNPSQGQPLRKALDELPNLAG